MLVEKFKYPELKRVVVDGVRYYTDGNEVVPSVTTVLGKTADISYLIEWRKRVGDAAAAQITKESAGLGTMVHGALERYMLGETNWQVEGDNHVRKMARTMASAIVENGLVHANEVWGVEVPLLMPGAYSGTTDAVGVYKNRPAIIDFKTSRKPKKKEYITEYFLQTTLYALAHNAMFDTDIRQAVVLIAVRDGSFNEFIIEDEEFDKFALMALTRVAQYYSISIT